jgi:hypothetical protein
MAKRLYWLFLSMSLVGIKQDSKATQLSVCDIIYAVALFYGSTFTSIYFTYFFKVSANMSNSFIHIQTNKLSKFVSFAYNYISTVYVTHFTKLIHTIYIRGVDYTHQLLFLTFVSNETWIIELPQQIDL